MFTWLPSSKNDVVCKNHSHDPSQLAILKVNNKAWECNIFVTCKWTCSTWIVIILPSSNIDSQSRNDLRKSFSMFVTILDKICIFQNKFKFYHLDWLNNNYNIKTRNKYSINIGLNPYLMAIIEGLVLSFWGPSLFRYFKIKWVFLLRKKKTKNAIKI